MSLEFAQPWCLLALAALPLAAYAWRRRLTHGSPGRQAAGLVIALAALALAALALAGPQLRTQTPRQMIVAAVDASASITDAARRQAAEAIARVQDAASGQRAAGLMFAAEPGEVVPLESLTSAQSATGSAGGEVGSVPLEQIEATNLSLALAAARAAVPSDYVPRLLLLSDGNQTRGDAVLAAKLNGVPIDVFPLPAPADEVYLTEAITPEQVRPGIAFEVEAAIESLSANEGTVELAVGAEVLAALPQKLAPGENRVRIPLTLADRAADPLTIRLAGFRDALVANNQVVTRVALGPKPRVLVVEGQPAAGERLAAALGKNYFDLAVRAPETAADRAADLSPFELVVLVNVPAAALPAAKMQALGEYARDGGGLLVVGGDQAFTPGGYRGTPLDDLLPLAADAKDKPRPALALVLVIDASMSMQGSAIDLARQATRRAVELLSPRDQVGVLSFADEARWISPIHPCSDKPTILGRLDGIAASGRTNMYPALRRAYLALREAYADRKHILLMTDGVSDPGDFHGLARAIAQEGITISTVGLGGEVAQETLRDIARLGNGNYHYCQDASAVPRVFALETSSAGRVGITEEPFVPRPPQPGEVFTGIDLGRLPTLMAYAETRPKPDSTVLLSAGGDDVLLAVRPVGRGRVAAFASDVQSRWAAAWLRWPEFDRFWTQLARHIMRPAAPQPPRRATADYGDEFRIRPTNEKLLREIAAASGGRFRPAPADLFAPDGRTAPRVFTLWPAALSAALLLLLAGVAVRRGQ